MNPSTVVPVELGSRSYSIHICPDLKQQFGSLILDAVSPHHVVVITDDRVAPLYLQATLDQLEAHIPRVDSMVVPQGETSKSIAQCDALWQKMVERDADRDTVVVALGGGVVGDLAGFIAASFNRGLRFIQIPTTLLAQVDSSVGGKVGVNLPQGKNLVGAFWQPQTVLIDPTVLKTLDQRNYRAGMAEVIKYGVIMDPDLFEFLEQSVDRINGQDPETLSRIIAWCCSCKATVVAEDETETTGRRAILNYGHTFGHAIESVFGYGSYLHGEAIAIGMTGAAKLAERLNRTDETLLVRQTKLFEAVGLPTELPPDQRPIAELVDAMKHDKKVRAGKLRLILPTRIGHVESVDAPPDRLLQECF